MTVDAGADCVLPEFVDAKVFGSRRISEPSLSTGDEDLGPGVARGELAPNVDPEVMPDLIFEAVGRIFTSLMLLVDAARAYRADCALGQRRPIRDGVVLTATSDASVPLPGPPDVGTPRATRRWCRVLIRRLTVSLLL
jgi:hypothetical protein